MSNKKTIGIFGSRASFLEHGSEYETAIPMLNENGVINSGLVSGDALLAPLPELYLTERDTCPVLLHKYQMAKVVNPDNYYWEYGVSGWTNNRRPGVTANPVSGEFFDAKHGLFIDQINVNLGAVDPIDRMSVINAMGPMTRYLRDGSGAVIDQQQTRIIVSPRQSPSSMKRIVCVGDSTSVPSGYVPEIKRRLATNTNITTDPNYWFPTAYNLSNIKFVGSQTKEHCTDSSIVANYEARAGWHWGNFTGSGSPFYYSGALNFSQWASAYCDNVPPDIMIIMLTFNISENPPVDQIVVPQHQVDACNQFLTALNTAWGTACKVYLSPPYRLGVSGASLSTSGPDPTRLFTQPHKSDMLWWKWNMFYLELAKNNPTWIRFWPLGQSIDPQYGWADPNWTLYSTGGPRINIPSFYRFKTSPLDSLSTGGVHNQIGGQLAQADAATRAIMHGINNP